MTVSEWTKSANFADLPFAQSALYVLAPALCQKQPAFLYTLAKLLGDINKVLVNVRTIV